MYFINKASKYIFIGMQKGEEGSLICGLVWEKNDGDIESDKLRV